MCGIIGGTNPLWDYKAATNALFHRGPDSQKIIQHPDISLAFTRLAIIDLSSKADQPMKNDNDTVVIVFNGEIYGYKELRSQLLHEGYQFHTTSDTEVVLNAYLRWGNQFIHKIDGMFAIAIHDKRTSELKLFRDRVGIKPLFYYFNGDNFAFASELKAVTALLQNQKFHIDYTALYDFLTYKFIPEPKSLYKNIYKLPPAHLLIFDLKQKKISNCQQYWTLDPTVKHSNITLADASRQLRGHIQKSIKDQMIADVPVGFFLSGGLDSSTVVFESCMLNASTETFSIGFEQKGHNETHYAQLVAQQYNTNHHVKILSEVFTNNLFPRMRDWFDEPFADTSAYPTFFVSKFAKEKVTVVLTGDGGDEIFGGYRWYNIIPFLRKIPGIDMLPLNKAFLTLKSFFPIKSIPYKLLNQIDLFTSKDLPCYIKLIGGMTTPEKQAYAQRWGIPLDYDSYWYIRKFYKPDLPLRTRLQYLDFHTFLASDILTKVDRTTMSVSLEARVPLLSKDIIEFCFSIPESLRYYRGELKGLLKKTYSGHLPKAILSRGKQGFSIPRFYLNLNRERYQEKLLQELFPY